MHHKDTVTKEPSIWRNHEVLIDNTEQIHATWMTDMDAGVKAAFFFEGKHYRMMFKRDAIIWVQGMTLKDVFGSSKW